MFPDDDFARAISVASESEIAALPADTEAVLVKHLSDSLARALGRLSSLRVLLGDGSPSISDHGLESLGRLVSLEALDLEWAVFSDTGLRYLTGLSRLRWLDLSFCRGFSEAGLQALRAALPACSIELASDSPVA